MLLKLTKLISSEYLPYVIKWIQQHAFHLLLSGLLLYLLVQKDVTLSISFNNNIPKGMNPPTAIAENDPKPSNIRTTPAPILTAKQQKQVAYVQRFSKVATTEMEKYGIPASIKLAQGLLESNAGNSTLAMKNNNHFGIKCFSKKCSKGHCSNFTDDSHKDFFRVFTTSWESYRAHSELLQSSRYRNLTGNYKDWAYGLVKAGYATDPKYGEKLIDLIETLELYLLPPKSHLLHYS